MIGSPRTGNRLAPCLRGSAWSTTHQGSSLRGPMPADTPFALNSSTVTAGQTATPLAIFAQYSEFRSRHARDPRSVLNTSRNHYHRPISANSVNSASGSAGRGLADRRPYARRGLSVADFMMARDRRRRASHRSSPVLGVVSAPSGRTMTWAHPDPESEAHRDIRTIRRIPCPTGSPPLARLENARLHQGRRLFANSANSAKRSSGRGVGPPDR